MKKFYFLLVAMLVGFAANADYYLIGGFNGWALKDANCKFADQGDGTFKLEYKGTLSSGFKVNDGTWGAVNFGSNGSNLEVGVPYEYVNSGTSGNIGISENIENPTLILNPTAGTLLIEGKTVEATFSYCLHGTLASSTWADVALTEKDGLWVNDNVVVSNAAASFGIKKNDASTGNQVEWLSADGASSITGAGTFKCKVDGTNFSIATGTYGLSFDPKTMTLTVTGGNGGDIPVNPTYEGWYFNVLGDFNGWEDNGVTFDANGKAEIKNLAIDANGFKIKVYNGETKKDEYFVYTDGEVTPGQDYVIYLDIYDAAPIKIAGAAAGDVYNVSFDYPTKTMVVTKVSSGVEVVEAENAAAEYFNLQGVKVAEPTSGLYIVKRGNKVTKEIVK